VSVSLDLTVRGHACPFPEDFPTAFIPKRGTVTAWESLARGVDCSFPATVIRLTAGSLV